MDVNGHTIHIVLGTDEHSGIVRTCLKRPSDGYFAVGYVERVLMEDMRDKRIEELATPVSELNFTTEDAAGWTWHPTLDEAVQASKVVFSSFEKWTANAPNQ